MRGRKLLLADDDRLILATTAAGLRSAGFAVEEARSVDAAIKLLESFVPDIALLDIRMGHASGFDLARHLQEAGDIPFMFLSAYGDDLTVSEATALGAVGFVVKPVDIAQLIPAIEAALARASDLRRLRSTGRQLEQALDQQRSVSVAIGILMERHHLTREEAQNRLRDAARAQRRKMTELAEAIVGAGDLLALSSIDRGEN
jgi:two-component system, response regulator PdtaR